MSAPTATPSVGGWTARLPPGLLDAVALFLTMRLALGLVAAYLWWRGGLPGPCHFELARNGWLTLPPLADDGAAFPLVGVWQRWDACWYAKIATFGYEPAEMSANFWPLYPALMGVVGGVLGGAPALGGLVVSGIAYIAAMTGLVRLVARDVDPEVARRTVLFVSIFPSAFFLFAPFTEALFLALAVWTMVAARERRWAAAFVLGLLAATTRIQGVFLLLPVAWEAAAAAGLLDWRPRSGVAAAAAATRRCFPAILAAGGPLLGFAGFLAATSVIAGRTPLDTQDAWGGTDFHPPWAVAAAAWDWAVSRGDPLQALNLGLLVLAGVLLAAGLGRLPAAYLLFALPQLVLLATRIQPTPLTSTNRYLLVIFPIFVVLAMVPWRRVRLAWAIVSTLFLGLLVQSFLAGDYVA